jgi:hypothetical protein
MLCLLFGLLVAAEETRTNFFRENFQKYGSAAFIDNSTFGYKIAGRGNACQSWSEFENLAKARGARGLFGIVSSPTPANLKIVVEPRRNMSILYLFHKTGEAKFVNDIERCANVIGNMVMANTSWVEQITSFQHYFYTFAMQEIEEVVNDATLLQEIEARLHTCGSSKECDHNYYYNSASVLSVSWIMGLIALLQ